MFRLPRPVSPLWNQAYLLLITTAAAWGGNTIFSRMLAGQSSPMLTTFLRWFTVSLIMWPFAAKTLRAAWPVARPKVPHILFMALLGLVANNTLIYFAAYHTSAVNMSIFQSATPIFVLAGSMLILGLRSSWQQLAGIVVALAGVVAIAVKGDLTMLRHMTFNIGDVFMVLSCVCYAGYMLLLRNKPALPGPLFFTLLATSGAVCAVPFAGYEYAVGALQWPSAKGWLLIVLIAVFASVMAQLFFIRSIELIGPARTALFLNLIPIFGTTFAVLFLGEPVTPIQGAGLALVLSGIWLAERR